jgi:NAD(P)-dependent dehydrogenase (short-subunit alcohol dehydrogenase family)
LTGEERASAAVVTGAGSGIGRSVARALAADGYRVALAGRRADRLAETAQGHGDSYIAVPTDVTDEAEVERLFERAVAELGRVDLLFNNAGVFGEAGPIEDLSLEDWRLSIDTNLTGMFLCARAALRQMVAQSPPGGRIINNGSLSAQVPRPHAAAYTASKSAVTGLTKAISLEGRGRRVACGQIDVGNATTEMNSAFSEEGQIDVRHVADAVLFMSSLPLEANVQFMTLMATDMPFIGRG